MIGAILGDIIGSPYEFCGNMVPKRYPLFSERCGFTDDTVMTLAVGTAFSRIYREHLTDDGAIREIIAGQLRAFALKYPNAGYGGMFRKWFRDPDAKAYGSYGNGSAMRVSSVAWFYDDPDAVRHAARLSAEVTHNHPEGIKGAEATASAVFLARTGHSKAQIRSYIEREFGYDLSRTLAEIRPVYRHNATCAGTVPEAILAFLEGRNFEHVIRKAVSLRGDTDTLAAIAGSIAEGFYPVPAKMKAAALSRLPEELRTALCSLEQCIAWKDIDCSDGYVPFGITVIRSPDSGQPV